MIGTRVPADSFRKKEPDLKFILRVEPRELDDGLIMGDERKILHVNSGFGLND